MIDSSRVLAIIPARAGSKGLPGKNVRPLAGKPLLAWPVEAARGSRFIDKVVVSTDSEAFAAVARQYGAEVPTLRPAELAADTSPSSAAVTHMLDVLASQGEHFDYLVLLEPTSPLTEAQDIDSALAHLHAHRQSADAIVGVAELVTSHPAFAVRRLPDGRIEPFAEVDFSRLPRRQDVAPLFALDGSLYISKVAAYRENLSFCHGRTLSHLMPDFKAHEVDSLLDFIVIEAILAHYDELRTPESLTQTGNQT